MKNNIKELVKTEIVRRSNNARKYGSTETAFSTIQRLSGLLMKPCKVKNEIKNEIKNVRAYLLAYDRKELKSILVGMKLNRQTGAFSVFNKGLNIDLKYCFARIEDFKK